MGGFDSPITFLPLLMTNDTNRFPGFPPIKKGFWMYPKILDLYRYQLTPQEQVTLSFLLRRTVGFQKLSDKISLSQFSNGLGKYDKGTGLSRKQVIKSIKGLETKGFIVVMRGGKINEYSLVLSKHQDSTQSNTTNGAREAPLPGVGETHTIHKVPIEKAIDKIYKTYCKYVLSGTKLTKKGKELITERFTEYHPLEMIQAMKNFGEDEWQMEHNAKRGPSWFFANEDRVAQFLNVNPLPPDHPIYKNEDDKPLSAPTSS